MIYVFSFLMDITVVFLMLGLNFRAVDAGASPTQLGVLQASFAVPYTLLCFFLARRLSSLDARICMTLSSVCLLTLSILSGVLASLPAFILLAVLIGAATAFFWPPLEHYLGRGKPVTQLYTVLSRFNLWWCSGYAVATAACGLLYDWSFRLPFFIAAACVVPIIAGSPFLASAESVSGQTSSSVEALTQSSVPLHKKKFFLTTARIFIFLTYASAGCIFALFPKLGDSLDLDKPLVSRIIFFLYMAQLLSFYILGRTRRWQYNLFFLLGGQLLIAVAFLAVFISNSTIVFAGAFAIVGLASGLTYFSSLFYTLHEPVFQSSLAGVHEALLAAGRLIGPLFCGAIAGTFNLKTPYLFLACIFAVFTVQTLLRGRRLTRGVPQP